jgi:hypothetical protein
MTISLAPVSNGLAVDENTNTLFSPVGRELSGPPSRLSGASSCKPFDPDRHSLPCVDSYHSGRVIARGFNRPKEGSGFDDFDTEGKRLKLPSRVKEFEMNVGTYPARLKKTNSEAEKRKAWLHTESRLLDSMRNPSRKREGKSLLPPPESEAERKMVQPELINKKLCVRCQKNEQYMNLDICEPCVSEIAGL